MLIHDEPEHSQLIPCWEAIGVDNVSTPKEVFEGLAKEGYSVLFSSNFIFTHNR